MTTKSKVKKTPFFAFFGSAVFAALLSACGSGSIVQDKFTVPNENWEMSKVFVSKFEVEDTINPYNFYVNVRNGGDYPYSNLHLFVTTVLPNGKKAIDTVNCPLADKSGRWLGKGLGDIIDNRIMFRYNRVFPTKGTYKIAVQHAMRDTVLPAILNIGIAVERTEN